MALEKLYTNISRVDCEAKTDYEIIQNKCDAISEPSLTHQQVEVLRSTQVSYFYNN